MDWFHSRLIDGDSSRYPWAQFLRFAVYCTAEHGSALFDSTLGDPDMIEEMYQQAIADQSKKAKAPDADDAWHPTRRGYTREVAALLDVADNLIALRAERGQWKGSSTRFSARPLFPSQAVDDRMRDRNRAIRDERIAASQARWRSRNAAHSG